MFFLRIKTTTTQVDEFDPWSGKVKLAGSNKTETISFETEPWDSTPNSTNESSEEKTENWANFDSAF